MEFKQSPNPSVFGLAINRPGTIVATVGWDEKIRIWKIPSGELIAVVDEMDYFKTPNANAVDRRMHGIRFSPNGKRIAAAHMDGTISVWDATNPADLRLAHEFPIGSRALSTIRPAECGSLRGITRAESGFSMAVPAT